MTGRTCGVRTGACRRGFDFPEIKNMLRKRMMSKKMSSGKSLIETLERRQLLANVLVTSLADSGAGSLRQAISDATSGDTIDLRFLSGVIELDTEITFNKNLTLNGPGANVLTIDGQDASRFGRFSANGKILRALWLGMFQRAGK